MTVLDDLSELLARTRTVVPVARETDNPIQREFDHVSTFQTLGI